MDNETPLEPGKVERESAPRRRKPATGTRKRRLQRALTPGQLHLLAELLGEFADQLTSVELGEGDRGFQLASSVPNLVDFIEFQVERLRERQSSFESLYLADAGR